MLRKWEWIKEQCLKRGLKEPAKVAGEIDVILLENYDTEHTLKWIMHYKSTYTNTDLVSRSELLGIAADSRYCISCFASDMNCYECRFGNLCGICGDPDSLYKRFFTEFNKTSEVVEIPVGPRENINGRPL